MRLRAEQLPQHLKKGLLPIYWVTGDEPLLLQEACDQIRGHCRQQEYQRQRFHADGQFDWQTLLEEANSLSLFADRQLLDLQIESDKVPDKGRRALQYYAEHPNDDKVLLISSGKLDKSSLNAKWLKPIDQVGAIIQVWPLNSNQLTGWIQNRLKSRRISADAQAIELIAERVQGNLLAASQEIDKLQLLGHQHIDADIAGQAVTDSARFDLFSVVDAALLGDCQTTARSLQGLQAEGEEPILLLWAITRELRQLKQIKRLTEQGMSMEAAANKLRVWKQRQGLLRQACRRFTERQLDELIQLAALTDSAIKGQGHLDAWQYLNQLLLRLAGAPIPICPI